jgi:hypothetical protein
MKGHRDHDRMKTSRLILKLPRWRGFALLLLLVLCMIFATITYRLQFELCKFYLDILPQQQHGIEFARRRRGVEETTTTITQIPCYLLTTENIRNHQLVLQLQSVCSSVTVVKDPSSSALEPKKPWMVHVADSHLNLLSMASVVVDDQPIAVFEDDALILKITDVSTYFTMAETLTLSNPFFPLYNAKNGYSYRSGTVAYLCRAKTLLNAIRGLRCDFNQIPIDLCLAMNMCLPSCNNCPIHHGKFNSTRAAYSKKDRTVHLKRRSSSPHS